MAAALVIIKMTGDSPTNATPGSRQDLALSTVITFINQSDAGVSTWAWTLVDKPRGSSAVLSSSSASTTTLTADIAGTYLVNLTVNNDTANSDQVGAAVLTPNHSLRKPAAGETLEFDTIAYPTPLSYSQGWAGSEQTNYDIIDTISGSGGLSAIVTLSPYTIAKAGDLDQIVSTGVLGGGSTTTGIWFYTLTSAHITGANFWWYPGTSRTVKCTLWDVHAGTATVTGTVSTTGVGSFTCSLSSTALTSGKLYALTMWDTSGSDYSKFTFHTADPFSHEIPMPQRGGDYIMYNTWGAYASLDAFPDSPASNERYPIEPILTIP
jgi:hypothetical protein